MDLRYSDSDEAFRAELRTWLAAELPKLSPPPAREDWTARRAFDTDWQRRLFDAGYAGINWPKEYGGRGASPSEQLVFLEETGRARAPYVGVNFVGLLHAGPTIIAEGTEEQKAAHLPSILRGEEVWCQGFSEPNAGSDLASLRTRAVRDGDHYVVTGQKTWCSFGHIGDVGELLVRTDPDVPKHKGITWLMLPMDLPGIEVRPIETVLGSSEFCELFLDEVRVPVENRVGGENDGWRVTNVTLSFERGTAFVSELVDAMQLVEDLAPLIDDAGQRRELGHVAAELDALWALTQRNVTQAERDGVMGPGAMMIKLGYTEARQRLGELSLRVLGRGSLDLGEAHGFVEERLRTLALTIAAGTSQIQRNIVGERVLGLPKEPLPRARSGPGLGRPLMDFDLGDDQRDLRDGIRNLLGGALPMARVREGFDRAMWDELVGAGVFGLLADGFTWTDAAVVFEELGRAVVPGPLVWGLLAHDPAHPARVVGGLERPDAGTPAMVEHLAALDVLVVLDADGIEEVDPAAVAGDAVERPLDPLTPVTRVAALPAGTRVADAGVAGEWRTRGAVLTAAYAVGMADACTALSVAYAKEREQFSRPIGSFQAVKHLCADMAVRVEVARAATHAAAVHLDDPGLGGTDRAASGAKLLAGEAAVANGRSATQVHGGMGFTWEVDVHLFLKRAWVLDTHFGSGDDHADRVAAACSP